MSGSNSSCGVQRPVRGLLLAAWLVSSGPGCVDLGDAGPSDAEGRLAGPHGRTATGVACPVERSALRLSDGTELYVEPEAVMQTSRGTLVVGTPTYTWNADRPGVDPMRSRDAHLAAHFGRGPVELLPKPIAGLVGSVRPVPVGRDTWGVVFSESGPDSLPHAERLIDVWYAEHDGSRWSPPELLPAPPEGRIEFAAASELVRAGTTLSWAAAIRLPDGRGGIRLYERRRDGWTSEPVADVWTEATTLAVDPSGDLWLAVVSEDPELAGWQKSLRLYRRPGRSLAGPVASRAWSLATRVWIAEPGTEIQDPRVTWYPRGLTVTWRSLGPDSALALARVDIGPSSDGAELTLDGNALQVVPVRSSSAAPTWLVHHDTPGLRGSELRVVRRVGSRAERVSSFPNPFTGFFGALGVERDAAIVIGPEFDPDPARPTVRSLVLRLSLSCT